MSVKIAPATISTTRTSTPILTNVRANVTPAGPKDQIVEGGIVHYVVRLDPCNVPQEGDLLTIQSWDVFAVDPTQAYSVFTVQLSGFGSLACVRVAVGRWVGR